MRVSKKVLTLLIFAWTGFSAQCQVRGFVVASSHFPYASEEEALSYQPKKSVRYQKLLNDTWSTSNGLIQSGDVIQISNDAEVHFTNYLRVPSSWKSHNVILHFPNVNFAYSVRINGQEQDHFEPIKNIPNELDLSEFVHSDSIMITVKISKGKSLPKSSWFGDVYAYYFESAHVSDINIKGYIEGGKSKIAIYWVYSNFLSDHVLRGQTYKVQVYDQSGVNLIKAYGHSLSGKLLGHMIDSIPPGQKRYSFYTDVDGAAAWTSETPNLYRVTLQFFDEYGRITQAFSALVGFRTFSQTPTGFALNRSTIKFRGVQLDTAPPHDAAGLTRDIRAMNANSIILPATQMTPQLLTAFDKHGLYVILKLDAELLSSFKLLLNYYQIAQNHPSVLAWYSSAPNAQKVLSDIDRRYHFWKRPRVITSNDPKNAKRQASSVFELKVDDSLAVRTVLANVILRPTIALIDGREQMLRSSFEPISNSLNSKKGLSGFFLRNYSIISPSSMHSRLFETLIFSNVQDHASTISILNCQNFSSVEAIEFRYEWKKGGEVIAHGVLCNLKIMPWEVIQVNVPRNGIEDLKDFQLFIEARHANVKLGSAMIDMNGE